MKLRQLMIIKRTEQRNDELAKIQSQIEELKNKERELEEALTDAGTDEELTTIEQKYEEIKAEEEKLNEQMTVLQEAIKELELELEGMSDKEPVAEETNSDNKSEKRGDTKMENRTEAINYLQREEVRDFYGKVREAVLNKRALTGTDLVIPQTVLDRIQPLISDYSNLYREVDVIQLNGTARAIVDGARPEAIWMEMCDPVEELAGAFEAVELDGFKVGGFIPVCNAILEDSMLDLASYVERTIAEAIAKAIDKAIMNGTGTKQPEGIVPNIVVGNKTTGETLAEILPSLGLVDTGEDQVGEIIAVMQRKTYYEKILPQTIATTDTGKQVVQGVNDPNIAGLRVVFSNYAPANKIILGDFKQYVLGERKGITLASSTDVRFIEDQTVFKGTARYDGKPVKKEAFAEVELVPGA